MNQKTFDAKTQRIRELKEKNKASKKRMEDISYELGGYQETVRTLSKESNKLFDKSEIRAEKIEKLESEISKYEPNN
jgi:chromosome segregation ATPase